MEQIEMIFDDPYDNIIDEYWLLFLWLQLSS